MYDVACCTRKLKNSVQKVSKYDVEQSGGSKKVYEKVSLKNKRETFMA